MTYSHACTRTAKFAWAAVLTTALTATAVGPMAQGLEHQRIRTDHQSVSVPLVALTAVESTIPVAAASASTATMPSPSDAAQAAATANATIGDFLYDAVRNVALAAGVAVLPLWWIGFPITFPIGYVTGLRILFPPTDGITPFVPFVYWVLSAVALPPILVSALFPPGTPSASASAPAVRSASAKLATNTGKTVDVPVAGRDNDSRQASSNPVAATPKRAAKPAAAEIKSKEAASAASTRSSTRSGSRTIEDY